MKSLTPPSEFRGGSSHPLRRRRPLAHAGLLTQGGDRRQHHLRPHRHRQPPTPAGATSRPAWHRCPVRLTPPRHPRPPGTMGKGGQHSARPVSLGTRSDGCPCAAGGAGRGPGDTRFPPGRAGRPARGPRLPGAGLTPGVRNGEGEKSSDTPAPATRGEAQQAGPRKTKQHRMPGRAAVLRAEELRRPPSPCRRRARSCRAARRFPSSSGPQPRSRPAVWRGSRA